MRVYYEDSYRYGHHHHHHRPNIEIDVFSGYGGAYYPPPVARPEVVVVNPAVNYMPLPGGQMMMPQPQPQPYGAMGTMGNMAAMGSASYYQQQQGYQYQYNNPPYPRW
ncbi:uncharacterized protein LOC117564523 [Drosophila albomicans]|uniref:Uncharacterized protein LOC117564523 n=1 Tax=Drosophila albomicans TaxID=7291 RepID=A0A6P8W708_DROAB|nr:uncharacterized protein LOC117564523 [Drosophila albomicans]